jgi:hypothetical protein
VRYLPPLRIDERLGDAAQDPAYNLINFTLGVENTAVAVLRVNKKEHSTFGFTT